MGRIWIDLAFAALIELAAIPAGAQDRTREVSVRFPAGSTSTTIKERLRGAETVLYHVGAEAGQTMRVTLRASNKATYFNVYAPGRAPGDQALAVSESVGPLVPDVNRFNGNLPASGTYTISVFLYRSAARRNETSSYTLDIAISPKSGAANAPVQSDFADGLAGGPDFFEVAGVPPGDKLNLRNGPSSRAPVLARAQQGARLRNLGCRMADGQRWCRVETTAGKPIAAWASGRFLIEGSAPPSSPATAPADAKVPGTRFHATGSIPCARRDGQPMATCQFGVVRRGGGDGTVTISWPDGGTRTIEFKAGMPVAYDRSAADGDARLSVVRNSDLLRITIGAQRFEIPDAVIAGG